MPNGASGLDAGAWLSEWVTHGDTLSALAGRTQDAITDYYRQQVQGSDAWTQAWQTFSQNIMAGFENLSTFLNLIVQAMTGSPGALTDLQTFVTARWNDIADSLAWLTHLGVLSDTFFKFLGGTKTEADLDAAWVQVCADFGITSPDWTTFWDQILAKYVTPQGLWAPAQDWQNYLNKLYDQYKGTTGSTGKSFNDVLSAISSWVTSLFGAFGNSTSLSGVATFATMLNSSINQIGQIFNNEVVTPINTAVGNLKAWWTTYTTQVAGPAKRLTNDLTILLDFFHGTYQAGTPTDAPGTLGTNGKATWYSAWNDLLALVGIVNSASSPVVTAPTLGESIQANTAAASIAGTNAALAIATNQDLTNKIIASQTGVEPAAGTSTDAQNALENIPASNVQGQTGALVTWGATGPVASAGPGTYSGNNAGTVTFTPTSTDTSLDIVVTYYGSQSSTRTLTVTDSSGNPVPLVNKFAGNAYGSNTPEVAVFRVSLTPTASPATLTFNVNVASTNGNSYWSAVGISYYGIKVSYSAPFGGALSYNGGAGTAVSMTRNSDNTKRLMMVLTWVGNAASTFSNLTAGASNRVPLSGSAAVYVSDIQGAPSGSTTTIGGKISSTNSGWSGSWAGLLVEMSN